MQDLSDEEIYKPLTPEQQEELKELKKKIPGYKPISWQGRSEICDECPSKVKINRFTDICDECGCILSIKQFVPFSECPLGKW